MKAEIMHNRPDYTLLKQTDIVSHFHYQMPRFLFEDSRYVGMSLESKFIYMLLFNRFQLSKANGWTNEDGEVFVIYTRQELVACLGIGEKRITAAMRELIKHKLAWERRCGRGFANQIYLAAVEVSQKDAGRASGGPLDALPNGTSENLRPANMTVQENEETEPGDIPGIEKYQTVPEQDPLDWPFLNGESCDSKPAAFAVLDPPTGRSRYIDRRIIDIDSTESSLSISARDGRTDSERIEMMIEKAELENLPESEALVFMDAIERLFYMASIRVGNAVYPRERIRCHLERIDFNVVQSAHGKITTNTEAAVKKSSSYVAAVLFNCIMESGSDLLVDPYLNSLRQSLCTGSGVP
ncbi:replication initiator protein A [Oscillospiraceae bacterium OttesenSCG-928-F05]|nr:replication initiator protein A [Oscillospiraceae bacterium OttesenSCG-928-F05]